MLDSSGISRLNYSGRPLLTVLQAVPVPDIPQLQQLLAEAANVEQAKRRQALEITFLQAGTPAAAAAAGLDADSAAAAAAATADPASSSSEDGDDDDDAAAAGDVEGDGFETGYSRGTRLRIQQAPADIAAHIGVPLARSVIVWHPFVLLSGFVMALNKPVGWCGLCCTDRPEPQPCYQTST